MLAYTANPFDLGRLDRSPSLPLVDEPFVETWRRWAEEAQALDAHDASRRWGAFQVLRRHLPELAFPVAQGVSHWPSYRQATLHGADPATLPGATGVSLEEPSSLELEVAPSAAGAVPILTVRDRATFVTLVRALCKGNEPAPVPDALGGLMITGYTNWHRLRELHGSTFAEKATADAGDRFMLLSDGPYSAVPAERLDLEPERWRELSLQLRRAHEEIHYLMRRLLGAMRNNLFDELIAEYAGMHQAWGVFRADWLRLFLGLVESDSPGRLDVYRGDPPLSEGAFKALGVLVERAIDTLEAFDSTIDDGRFENGRLVAVVGALASQSLEKLASPRGTARLHSAFERFAARL